MAPGYRFAANLRRLRRARGLSQAQLAAEIGMGRQQVTAWECEISDVKLTQLLTLKRVLNCSWEELLDGADLPAWAGAVEGAT